MKAHTLHGLTVLIRPPSCGQVILAFNRTIWPPDFFDVVCVDSFIPEFWATTYPPPGRQLPGGASAQQSHVLVGFVTGLRAVRASALPQSAIVQQALQQLDCMFGELAQACACRSCIWQAGCCHCIDQACLALRVVSGPGQDWLLAAVWDSAANAQLDRHS